MEDQDITSFTEPETPDRTPDQERQGLLTVLCILTFIWSGLNCIVYFFSVAAYAFMPQILEQSRDLLVSIYGDNIDVSQAAMLQPRIYYLMFFLLFAASVIGAAFMLSLRKVGFHIYAIAQALLLALPAILFHTPFGFGDLLITFAFVTSYATFLKQMH